MLSEKGTADLETAPASCTSTQTLHLQLIGAQRPAQSPTAQMNLDHPFCPPAVAAALVAKSSPLAAPKQSFPNPPSLTCPSESPDICHYIRPMRSRPEQHYWGHRKEGEAASSCTHFSGRWPLSRSSELYHTHKTFTPTCTQRAWWVDRTCWEHETSWPAGEARAEARKSAAICPTLGGWGSCWAVL